MAKEKRKQKNTIADDTLTAKQEAFCRHYVDTGNATEAYRMSYDCSKMKAETIWSNASRLLVSSKVAARINEIQQEYAKRSKVDREKVEKVLMDIIQVDPSEMYTYDEKTGKLRIKSPSQMPKHIRRALKSIKNKKGVISYEFNGKTEAARLLGAWNGWNAPTQIDLGGKTKQDIRIGFDDDEE